MTFFFFLVGLELKRELLIGELASLKRATLPLLAALGGMAVPGFIYAAFNRGTSAQSGWGIPMATDIAFALGALSVFGHGLPASLRIFLTALATLDDIGSILLIAIFYSRNISLWALFGGALSSLLLFVAARKKLQSGLTYLILGVVLWLALFKAGIQPTLAGVITALAIPIQSPFAARWEKKLEPWIIYGVVPLFAIANAGISFRNGIPISLTHPIFLGVFFGLALGKPLGITLLSYLGVKSRLANLPRSANWRQMIGISCLAGIGFTVSLFVSQLTFSTDYPLAEAKFGILAASILAGSLGWWILIKPVDKNI